MAFKEELDKEFAAETAFIENNKERSSELFGYPLLDQ